ncbi:tyrosine-type recombinase/integrase [Sphingomonas sp. T9W2]|uniref:tyrosine-type recombinase/integrase n=1 Tax=Sphingomonas sp. T9W2 TaxID=3143183 RepID=UPI0031F5A160
MRRNEDERYPVGEYWLDKRRDKKSDYWQICHYSAEHRSTVYRSTRTRDLEKAKVAIHAYVEAVRATKPQKAEDALVAPQIGLYWSEHGKHTHRPNTIAGSLRAFVGFMMQDEIGATARVADLTPMVFVRFRKWRMAPHSFTVRWDNEDMTLASPGVKGESVQRNLDDVRAALNHSAANGRIPYAPKVPSVPTTMRSPARDVRVSLAELGAMVGFASQTELDIQPGDDADPNRHYRRWLQLMIATACRPEVAMLFDPRAQWRGDMIDLHPATKARTKKRNPVVPAIEPFKPILEAWRGENMPAVKSRKTAWRTMRRALLLPENVIPKTIRHTIATELRRRGVPAEQISGLLGHTAMHRTTEVYAKYDPAYLREAKAALTTIFCEVADHAAKWCADHSRTKRGRGQIIVVAKTTTIS